MRFLLADKVFNGENFLPDNPVLVVNENTLVDIIEKSETDPLKIQTLKGVIAPGFVNAHCHLELSHLKDAIPELTGLPEFGMQIMQKRNSFSKEFVQEAMKEADKEMWKNGIVACGDISNSSDSFITKAESNITYHSFIELLGLHPDRAKGALEQGLHLLETCGELKLRASLAPHAPYSTSIELIGEIAKRNYDQKLPSTIHNEESEDEMNFFKGLPSGFDKLYSTLKIDITFFKAPMCSSLQYYINSLREQKTLLVHNTFTSASDIELTKGKNILWCFCPNANIYIENRLPDYSLFKHENFCLGTDSLASNHQLDLISEANVILKNSSFEVEKILQSITSVPADFLGLEKFGRIKKANKCGLNLIDITEKNITFISKLI